MSENYEFTNADKAHADRKLVGTMDQFKPGDLLLCRDGGEAVYAWSSRFPALVWDGNRADTPFGEYKVYQDDTFDWCWVFGRDADCRGFVSEAEAKEHAGRDWADRLALAMGEVL